MREREAMEKRIEVRGSDKRLFYMGAAGMHAMSPGYSLASAARFARGKEFALQSHTVAA